MNTDTLGEYNHQISDMKQMLDELGRAADICFDLIGTVNLVQITIEALPLSRLSGQTVLRLGCIEPCNDLKANLLKLHEQVLNEIDHFQISLLTLTGGDNEPDWGAEE